jgi:magnesium transporter
MQSLDEFALKFADFDPKGAAQSLETCEKSEVLDFLQRIDVGACSQLLPHLNTYLSAAFFNSIEVDKAAELVGKLSSSYSASVLRVLNRDTKDSILAKLSQELANKIVQKMEFLPDTAGTFMDSGVFPLKDTWSVKECAKKIGKGSRSHYYLYVVNDGDQLVGVTTMRRVLETQASDPSITTIMDKVTDSIRVDDGREEILANSGWISFHSMPVVDYSNKFLGVIRYDTIRKIEFSKNTSGQTNDVQLASAALGELYSLGISVLAGSAASLVKNEGGQK